MYGSDRDHRGDEVDVVIEDGGRMLAAEIKSGQTLNPEFLAPLERLARVFAEAPTPPSAVDEVQVFAGDRGQRRTDARVLGWSEVHDLDWTLGRTGAEARPGTGAAEGRCRRPRQEARGSEAGEGRLPTSDDVRTGCNSSRRCRSKASLPTP